MIEYVTRGEWYDGEIRRFVRIDNENPPRKRGVLFVGSSIFREWREARDFAADVAPLGADCLNRAFGGSTTRDQLDVMEQIVFPHDPKVLVYYCGSNDVNAGVPPRVIRDNFLEWCARAFSRCPSARRILFVSIMRAPQKAPVWEALDEANALIREACGEEGEGGRRGLKRVSFVDVNPLLRDASTLEPAALQVLGGAPWIPFGDHPLKLERYREDQHGPCARMDAQIERCKQFYEKLQKLHR